MQDQQSSARAKDLQSCAQWWEVAHSAYACVDGELVEVPRRAAEIRDRDEQRKRPSSGVVYAKRRASRKMKLKVVVSGVEFGRDMKEVSGSSEGVRTIRFPNTVRKIRQEAFFRVRSLQAALLNEGLETVGEEQSDDDVCLGAFEGSELRRVRLPSTLKRIENCAFMDCKNLKAICFPEGLEYIGKSGFQNTGLRTVSFPASLRTLCNAAFAACRRLRSASFSEGLVVLESSGRPGYDDQYQGVFEDSALERVWLPASLKHISCYAFCGCQNLKGVALPKGLEHIGEMCFCDSGIESVEIPASVQKIESYAFYNCRSLRRMTIAEDSALRELGASVFEDTGLERVLLPPGVRVQVESSQSESV